MNLSNNVEFLLNSLKKAQDKGFLAHSYILVCESQEILNDFINLWLPYVICTDRKENQACGQCQSCKRWVNDNYASIYHLRSLSKSGQILVNDMQEFQQKFNFTTEEVMKIGVIHNAENIINQAQNSFLKTLEEPQKNTLFILLAKNLGKLLNTVISRCQHIIIPMDKISYTSLECNQLLNILTFLHPRSGVRVAIDCANKINALFKDLQKSCEEEIKLSVPQDIKKMQLELIGKNLYMKKRSYLISLIEAWYNQIFISLEYNENLTYNEFSNFFPKDFIWQTGEIEKCLHLCTILIKDYDCNLNENLIINDFCIQVCAN